MTTPARKTYSRQADLPPDGRQTVLLPPFAGGREARPPGRVQEAGHSIKAVSRRLGHADITITPKVYAHLMPNDDEKLAVGVETLHG